MDKIILFQEKEVRRVWHNGEWYFVINDIIKVLTNTPDVKSYWKRLKKQDPELAKGGANFTPSFRWQQKVVNNALIAKATFGVTPNEHSKIKGLEKENLRDHMTNLELIFAALGEEATRAIAVSEDAQGFNENHGAAVKGGNIAGKARRNLEKTTGKPVVEAANFIKKTPTIKSKEDPSV